MDSSENLQFTADREYATLALAELKQAAVALTVGTIMAEFHMDDDASVTSFQVVCK